MLAEGGDDGEDMVDEVLGDDVANDRSWLPRYVQPFSADNFLREPLPFTACLYLTATPSATSHCPTMGLPAQTEAAPYLSLQQGSAVAPHRVFALHRHTYRRRKAVLMVS